MIAIEGRAQNCAQAEYAPMAPWEQDRFKLFTPLDMIRFQAGLVIIYSRDLINQIGLLVSRVVDGDGSQLLGDFTAVQQPIDEALSAILDDPTEMPLSHALRRKIERLRERARTDQITTLAQIQVLLQELHNDIISELASPYFLMIPADRRWLYEQRQPPFGDGVANTFSAANYDITAASRCFALDEWTACVFHLMRVLEVGLRQLAEWVELPRSAIELENWKNIIDQIEKKIRAFEQQQVKSVAKSERLAFYGRAASNFFHFKDAWRNHVSHVRGRYDERDAMAIWNSVKGFMQALAEHSEPVPEPEPYP